MEPQGRPRQECRFYENRFPEVDEVVMVQVKHIAEMGAYVSLLEYNNIEGMILLSELSRRRIRSIAKLIKVGRQEPVMVLRVDKEKGYIDLSKRRVSPEEAAQCEERYNKSKLVHSIMRHVAEVTPGASLENLYTTIAWPLYKKFGHAYEAFKRAATEPELVFGGLESIDEEVKQTLLKDVKRRMTPQPHKIRADVDMTCFQYDGVIAIREAMRAAQACGTEEAHVEMKLIAAPLYVLTTQTLNKSEGLAALEKAVAEAKRVIESKRGKLVIKEAPKVVTAEDDRALLEQMAALEAANREVDGDADGSSDEDDGMTYDEKGPALAVQG
ncbi:unnamed protein product [Pedinophyceae sp. YPF-701]|nr:unnamed protein product [Pedinophyceae sp. YPF-701]